MRRHRFFLKIFFILTVILVWGIGSSSSKDRFHQFTMKNGLKVILEENRTAVVSFFKKWYVPNRMVFIAVGDFDLHEMEKKAREIFEEFRP